MVPPFDPITNRICTSLGRAKPTPPPYAPREDLLRRDRALRTSAAEEGDHPISEDGDAVLEPGQCIEVNCKPHQPAEKSRCADVPDRSDRLKARDRCHGSAVAVPERPLHRVATKPANDRRGRVATGLNRDLRESWQAVQIHQIANHEHFGVSRQRAVRSDLHASNAIYIRASRASNHPSER
jgi:hypothetical protein